MTFCNTHERLVLGTPTTVASIDVTLPSSDKNLLDYFNLYFVSLVSGLASDNYWDREGTLAASSNVSSGFGSVLFL